MCIENSCCNYGRARPQLLCMSDTPLSCISTKCILNRSYMLQSKHIGKWSFKRGSLKDGLGMYRSASKKVIPKHPLQLYCIKKYRGHQDQIHRRLRIKMNMMIVQRMQSFKSSGVQRVSRGCPESIQNVQMMSIECCIGHY